MVNAITTSLASLQAATQKVNASAERIANASESADLIEEAINLKLAKAQFSASVSVIKAQEDLDKELERLFDETV